MQEIVAGPEWTGDQVRVLGLEYRLALGRVMLGDQVLGFARDRAEADFLVRSDAAARILVALTPEARSGLLGVARVLHKKRGSHYRVLGQGRLQTGGPLEDDAALVIYRAEVGGALWARPVGEFEDGRFEVDPGFAMENPESK